MKKCKKIEKSDRNSSRYLEYLVVCMCGGRYSKFEFTEFLYKYYTKIYDDCHNDDFIAFKSYGNLYERCDFNILFTFIVNEYTTKDSKEKGVYVPIYKKST